eukprot:1642686-Rhodomonas_salina.1
MSLFFASRNLGVQWCFCACRISPDVSVPVAVLGQPPPCGAEGQREPAVSDSELGEQQAE